MKPRQRFKKIRESKNWASLMTLAKDVWPGTELDYLIFELTCLADYFDQFLKDGKKSDLHDEQLRAVRDIGFHFAKIIKHRKTDSLRKLADAVDEYDKHEPNPDKIRMEMLFFCRDDERAYDIRGIINHLQGKNLAPKTLDEDAYKNLRKKIERISREMGTKISGKSGNPQLGHKRGKKAR